MKRDLYFLYAVDIRDSLNVVNFNIIILPFHDDAKDQFLKCINLNSSIPNLPMVVFSF